MTGSFVHVMMPSGRLHCGGSLGRGGVFINPGQATSMLRFLSEDRMCYACMLHIDTTLNTELAAALLSAAARAQHGTRRQKTLPRSKKRR